jgi:single-strand DNA-binding protein
MYLNKVYIIGNLTRDPEIKALPSGIKVCSFGVATNRSYKDKEGVKKDVAEYHNIVAFGKLGELSNQYLKKGQSALIEGRLQTRSWESNGEKKYRTEIIADNVQFGWRAGGTGGGSYSGGSSSSGGASASPASASPAEETKSGETIEYPTEEINPDDIPF